MIEYKLWREHYSKCEGEQKAQRKKFLPFKSGHLMAGREKQANKQKKEVKGMLEDEKAVG